MNNDLYYVLNKHNVYTLRSNGTQSINIYYNIAYFGISPILQKINFNIYCCII